MTITQRKGFAPYAITHGASLAHRQDSREQKCRNIPLLLNVAWLICCLTYSRTFLIVRKTPTRVFLSTSTVEKYSMFLRIHCFRVSGICHLLVLLLDRNILNAEWVKELLSRDTRLIASRMALVDRCRLLESARRQSSFLLLVRPRAIIVPFRSSVAIVRPGGDPELLPQDGS
jgi:hypothetical protein